MDYNKFTVFLTSDKKVIVGGEGSQTTTSTETGSADNSTATTGGTTGGGLNMITIILIYAVVLGGAYFFMSRPQKKREKELKELQAAIGVGDGVVTSGGFYGKVVDTDADTFIIEFGTNKGIRIPVNKSEVYPSKNKKVAEDKSDN